MGKHGKKLWFFEISILCLIDRYQSEFEAKTEYIPDEKVLVLLAHRIGGRWAGAFQPVLQPLVQPGPVQQVGPARLTDVPRISGQGRYHGQRHRPLNGPLGPKDVPVPTAQQLVPNRGLPGRLVNGVEDALLRSHALHLQDYQ